MTERTKAVITWLVVVAAAAGTGACTRGGGDEDRPPIIVRGGSVIFEQQAAPGQTESPPWVDDNGQHWKPNQPNGKPTTKFAVSVTNPGTGQCSGLEGAVVFLLHSASNPALQVGVSGGSEPRVGPKGQLTENNGVPLKTLTFAGGDLTGVRVQGNTCQLNANSEVTITPME